MDYDQNNSSKKQISKLLLVLFFGALGAILLTVGLTYYYSKENHYLLENALVSPLVLKEIENGKNKNKTILDKIEYSYFDFKDNKRNVHTFTNEQYLQLYDKINNDVSLVSVSNEIESVFLDPSISVLSLYLNQNHQSDLFQEVQFSYRGDYYRLKLRESNPVWIYFYHPGIYEIIQNEILKL